MFKWRRKEALNKQDTKKNLNPPKTVSDEIQQIQYLPQAPINPAVYLLPKPPSGENLKLKENSVLIGGRTGIVIARVLDTNTGNNVLRSLRFQFTKHIYLEFRLGVSQSRG